MIVNMFVILDIFTKKSNIKKLVFVIVHDGTIFIDVNVVMLVERKKQIMTISISILEELEIFSPQEGDIGETTKEFKPNLEVV
jgi:hypothetical protein